ncbi:MAG: ABC transporter ATP-binding protein [Deinococcales bacterium]
MTTPAVSIRHLIKEFPDKRTGQIVRAVNDISFDIAEGEFFALLGPSGCGKTTTLRAIAGFEEPSSGEILIRGQAVQGIPPFHRPVNTVFQDYALFPHMTVLQNIMFGLKMEGVSGAEAKKRALEALDMVQLPQVAERKPKQLSGGQKQRIALARSLVKKPAVLLLDEPLGALDLKLRKAMQLELKEMQQQVGITFVYVTHDQEEAMTMADRIAIMKDGDVLQIGHPSEVYERPANRFVADFIGETNFLEGNLSAKDGLKGVLTLTGSCQLKATLRDSSLALGSNLTLAVRPEKVDLFAIEGMVEKSGGAMPASELKAKLEADKDICLLEATVLEAHYLGTDTRYTVEICGHKLVARVQNVHYRYEHILQAGSRVYVFWDIDNATILA